MNISKLFKKKDLTEKEFKEREYKKELKKIRNKLFKNPGKLMDFVNETEKVMDRMIKDGLLTEKEKEKQMTRFSSDIDKMGRITDKIRMIRGR